MLEKISNEDLLREYTELMQDRVTSLEQMAGLSERLSAICSEILDRMNRRSQYENQNRKHTPF